MSNPACSSNMCRRAALLAGASFGILVLGLTGCSRPDISDPDGPNFVAPQEPRLPMRLVNASFRLDGKLRTDRLNLATDRFVFLFVFVKSKGLFIVSAEEKEGTEAAGRFAGRLLTIIVSGTRIEFETFGGNILGAGPDRTAWVEHIASYDLLGPDARPDDAVIGLAERKELIPGFVEYEDG